MLTSDFDYELPAASIAQEAARRGESRLLVLDREGADRHAHVRDLPRLLRPGDLLVLNDTRVIPARLFGHRSGWTGKMELLLVERLSGREWDALVKPGTRAKPGTVIQVDEDLAAEVILKREDGRHLLRFSEPIEPHLERLGHVPLPPYIRRPDTAADRERYQTVYARSPGAVAAPTAGLHFTEGLLEEIAAAGIEIARVTLHVGIGTFKPVKAEQVEDHRMESERYVISEVAAAAIRQAREREGRVVAVGTTVVRTLESAAIAGGGEVLAGTGSTEI
ncbi:MAG TPA: tRNA preQ1(34) S-adenosylmethionine ribosyltransferase-isomerase QueA, partial [Thermoanaerobaculia bacterium]|nr:tRNA preQ1(34) S-adenosylmethionine ribosyltransferase-isomerase QueA [Thermoanaerobaculia bacterium]